MSCGRVLVVDDDPDFRSSVAVVLADSGHTVVEAGTGQEARAQLAASPPDVVLLDLGLPDVSGLDVLVELTRSGEIPVLVLSARSGETDRVVGLELGADDYMTKPFSARELVARVDAAIRRNRRRHVRSGMTFGELTINERNRDVHVGSRAVRMTAREFDLLAFLARSPRQVFTRAQLLEHVWKSSADWQDDSTVAEHISRIRRKLDPDRRERWIETFRGVGYRFAPRSE